MNEKIRELIDYCQDETDICRKIILNRGCSEIAVVKAVSKADVLDVIKDKLCSILEEDSDGSN